jgi:hypothetical protein
MSEPNEADEITRQLDLIFAEYYGPPAEMDLRGVDAATFAIGVCYGFDRWQDIRVAANSRRNVATAARHWDGQHPSREFLAHAVGTDESALGHRLLLSRAHPGCATCEEQLEALEQLERLSALDPDRVDPNTPPDLLDIEHWLQFQPVDVDRHSGEEAPGTATKLHVPGRSNTEELRAEYYGERRWRITIRHPEAHRATVRILWTSGHTNDYTVTFSHDLASIPAEAPEDGAQPAGVHVELTDPTEPL